MSDIVLFGRAGTGSAVCEALLELAGMPYTLKTVEKRTDGTVAADYLTINPLGQVPALQTSDGVLMTESVAISLWIADQAPKTRLAPALADPARAQYLRVMLFMAANCYMTALRFYYPERYSSDPADAERVREKAAEHMQREWYILSDMLGTADYLTGEAMSAADVYLSMLICWEEDTLSFARRYPKLAALNQRVMTNKTVAGVWKRNGFLQ